MFYELTFLNSCSWNRRNKLLLLLGWSHVTVIYLAPCITKLPPLYASVAQVLVAPGSVAHALHLVRVRGGAAPWTPLDAALAKAGHDFGARLAVLPRPPGPGSHRDSNDPSSSSRFLSISCQMRQREISVREIHGHFVFL